LKKSVLALATLLGLVALIVAGGSYAKTDVAAQPAAKAAKQATFRVGLVTDIGGLNDRGFNQSSYAGLKRAIRKLGIQGTVLTSSSQADYIPNFTSLIRKKYDLPKLRDLDELIASLVGIEIPYNNFVTGKYAFHHKAGMHTKAIYLNPNSYEILDPADFGLERTINVAHRLTGKHAIDHRAKELGLEFGEDELKKITRRIKTLADSGPLSMDQLDSLLREWVVA